MTLYNELSENAKELYLFVTMNPAPMGKIERSYIALERFKLHGTYDSKAALRLMTYDVNALSKEYAKRYSTSWRDWKTLFNVADRLSVAACLVRDFQTEYDAGNRWSEK